MKRLYHIVLFVFLINTLTSCNGQTKPKAQAQKPSVQRQKLVGGGCDGCELMYVGMPSAIKSVDTSAGWGEKGQKLLVTGTVYKLDGKTPAPNVIIYYWHTDNTGRYTQKKGMDEKAKIHGYLRGWVKTDKMGKYSIYTIRPVSYPNSDIEAHIHTSIKEPTIANEYYIDDFVFDDDPLLTDVKRTRLQNRGGSGILKVARSGDLQIVNRMIVLGLNIPDYPKN